MVNLNIDVDLSVADVIRAIDYFNSHEVKVLMQHLKDDGYFDEANGTIEEAIATLRHKLTTLALYPDMTALDVLDYIEEAIK